MYDGLNDGDFKIDYDDIVYDADNIFILYYIEQFQTLTQDIKTLITSEFTSDNVYFNNYSDDTGNITNVTSVIDNNTSPYFDLYDTMYNFMNGLPGSAYNKVSKNETDNAVAMHMKTDALMKTHLQGLQGGVDANTAKTSHGDNLVADNLYVDRLYLFKDPVNSQLKNIMGNMADFLQFFKNVNFRDQDPTRSAVRFKYTTDIESVSASIDMLKNKINFTPKTHFSQ